MPSSFGAVTRWRRSLALVITIGLLAPAASGTTASAHTPPASTDDNPCDDLVISRQGRVPDRHETVVQLYAGGAICELEQEVLAEIADDRGLALTPPVRDEILAYGRSEVRARLYGRLLAIADMPAGSRTTVEQESLEWFVDRYRALRIDMAQASIDEYERWEADPCSYVPPDGSTYNAGCNELANLFGPPAPPSAKKFVAYGGSIVAERMTSSGDIELLTEDFIVDYTAAVVGGAIAATVPFAIWAVLAKFAVAVLPYAFQAKLAASAAASVTGTGTVAFSSGAAVMAGPVAIILLAAIVIAIRTVQVISAAKIPQRLELNLLEAELTNESHIDPSDDVTLNHVMLAFIDATSPDHPTPPPSAVPDSTPPADNPAFRTSVGQNGPWTNGSSFDYLDDNGMNRAWIVDEWWVVRALDHDAPIRLQPTLKFYDASGTAATARVVDDEIVVRLVTDPSTPECPSATCFVTTKFLYLTRDTTGKEIPGQLEYTGRPPVIDSGPTAPATANDGETITLSATASDPRDLALTYEWTVSRPALNGVGAITARYTGSSISHTFAGAGQYDVDLVVTNELGGRDEASTTVDVEAVPVIIAIRTLDTAGNASPFFEGSTSGRLEVTAETDSTVSVDWFADGFDVDTRATSSSSSVALFTSHPLLDQGAYRIRVSVTDDATGTLTADELVTIDVANAAPGAVDIEVMHEGVWKPTTVDSRPRFVEGDTVTARFRATDPGDDLLDFEYYWFTNEGALAGNVTERSGGNWITVTYRYNDESIMNRFFPDLAVRVTDDEDLAGPVGKLWIDVRQAAPTIKAIDHDTGNDGVVNLEVEATDAVHYPFEITAMSIDWGDGSEEEELDVGYIRSTEGVRSLVVYGALIGAGEHQYAAPGTYTATATVTDDDLQTDVRVFDIVVPAFRPVISGLTRFDVGQEDAETIVAIEVDDPDTDLADLIVSVDWGDGSTPSVATFDPATPDTRDFEATHRYTAPGTYDVTFSAVDDASLEAEPLTGRIVVVDAAPTVTVAQASGQSDPTSEATVRFDVVFSEAVSGFESSDVTLGGTAEPGSVTIIDSGDATNFTLEVTGMERSGTVTASLGPAVVFNANGTTNLASTGLDDLIEYRQPIAVVLPGEEGVVTASAESGRAGATVSFVADATGGVGSVVVSCTPESGSFFPIGATDVSCTATDSLDPTAGGSLAASRVLAPFRVVVVDAEAPEIAPIADVVVESTDGNEIEVDFSIPTASDNSGQTSVVCSPGSGAAFPVGSTTVKCTATDPSGNATTSAFAVAVRQTPVAATATTTSTAPAPNSSDPTSPAARLPATGSGPGFGLWAAVLTFLAGLLLLVASRRRWHPGR